MIMAIKMIDRIPGHTPVLTSHDGLVSDILKIVDEEIPLCEITDTGYKDSYMRDALKYAIRTAVSRRRDRKGLGSNQFRIFSRKDPAGNVHWYVQYQGPGREGQGTREERR